MKLNRLETHDRFEFLIKDQSISISQGCQDCLKKNPLSLALQEKSHYIYIFAHPRTAEDGVTKKMFWQPRLFKPEAQPNSYLFRAQSKSDNIEVCWLLPPKEMWGQYKKGNITENEIVTWSIDMYRTNKKKLEQREPDDLIEEAAKVIYKNLIGEHLQDIRMKKMIDGISKPGILAAY